MDTHNNSSNRNNVDSKRGNTINEPSRLTIVREDSTLKIFPEITRDKREINVVARDAFKPVGAFLNWQHVAYYDPVSKEMYGLATDKNEPLKNYQIVQQMRVTEEQLDGVKRDMNEWNTNLNKGGKTGLNYLRYGTCQNALKDVNAKNNLDSLNRNVPTNHAFTKGHDDHYGNEPGGFNAPF